jgi:hypothetical protein
MTEEWYSLFTIDGKAGEKGGKIRHSLDFCRKIKNILQIFCKRVRMRGTGENRTMFWSMGGTAE